MNTIVDNLRTIIKSEFHVDGRGNKLILKEENEAASCLPITVDLSNTRTLCICTDKDSLVLHPLLEDGVNKTSDYIIFAESENRKTLFIVAVELKSNKTSGWTKQGKSGLVIGEYLLGMLEMKLGRIYENIELRCLLFSLKGQKQDTKNRKITYKEDIHFKYKYLHKRCGATLRLERYLV
ncbi:MAG: hypothetical protein ACI97N_002040 [Cognaticolwellia sp.]|jgi:hypothetical protein